jgi:hypothetical protein
MYKYKRLQTITQNVITNEYAFIQIYIKKESVQNQSEIRCVSQKSGENHFAFFLVVVNCCLCQNFLQKFGLGGDDELTAILEKAQGCQICIGKTYQNRKNIPNDYKMYLMAKYIPNGCQICQLQIKYTNIFHSKVLQNVPKQGFWFENICTIWQPGKGVFPHIYKTSP